MTRTASVREKAYFGDDVEILTPATRAELMEAVADAEASGRTVVPAGLGAHAGVAPSSGDAILVSTAALDEIAKYEPDDFTIGVEAGMPLSRLREMLAAKGQELPADLGTAAGTVGGLVARAPVGPRVHRHGSISSLLLGAEGVRGAGKPFRGGGMVVKNVAGYQVHKLMAGSSGRLGVLTRANFRLRPLPARRVLLFAGGDAAAVDAVAAALKDSRLEPALVRICAGAPDALRRQGFAVPPGDEAIAWSFEGANDRVAWQSNRSEELVNDAGLEVGGAAESTEAVRFLDAIASMTSTAPGPSDRFVVRLSVLPTDTAAVAAEARVSLAGSNVEIVSDPFLGVVHVIFSPARGGSDLTALTTLRHLCVRFGGTARVVDRPPAALCEPVLHEAASSALSAAVRDVFDPRGTFAASSLPEGIA